MDPLGQEGTTLIGTSTAHGLAGEPSDKFNRLAKIDDEWQRQQNNGSQETLHDLQRVVLEALDDQTSLPSQGLQDVQEAVANNSRLLKNSAVMQQHIYKEALSNGKAIEAIKAVATKLKDV